MLIQRQPNRWSCFPTAFAMLMDIEVKELIEVIGHDGSEIIFPDLPEPYRRRGFDYTETMIACLDFGFVASPLFIEHEYGLGHPNSIMINHKDKIIKEVLPEFHGVACGKINNKFHALAWNGEYHDPSGNSVDNFEIDIFFLLKRYF